MINIKSTAITLLFIGASLGLVSFAIGIKTDDSAGSNYLDVEIVEESIFRRMNFFSLSGADEVLALEAESLRVVGQRDLYFTEPDGILYNEAGEKIAYKAREGEFKDRNQELILEGDVELESSQGDYKADRLYYNGSKEFLEARGNILANMTTEPAKDKMTISSNYMSSWLKEQRSLFIGEVDGKLARRRAYEGSFSFQAQRMELKQLESLITLQEDVELQRNNYDLAAQRAEIFLENFNKRLKYYVLYDDIKLVEELTLPDGTIQARRAFSEKLEGFMSQGKIVLTGAPRVEQAGDLIKGYQIVLRENIELVEVEEAQSSFKLQRSRE